MLRIGVGGGPEDVDAGAPSIGEAGGSVVDEDAELVAAGTTVLLLEGIVDAEEDEEDEALERCEDVEVVLLDRRVLLVGVVEAVSLTVVTEV